MSNIIAIVGRPNVGKSTLFNRLVGERKAIMDNISGVTRDRHYGTGHWNGKEFSVIDTGGYVMGSEDIFEEAIRKQVELAIEESDIVLFMVDVDAGLTGLDNDFAKVLRKSKKPLFVVANKADNTERFHMSSEFYKLGMGEVFPVSSINGSGTGELLDEVAKHLEEPIEETGEELPKIAILGKPNVGKSSLLNVLLGKERSIVTEIAGTTRDAINSRFNAFGMDLLLIDTAGLRKKSKVHEDIEFYSVLRTVRTLETADVCMVLIDAENGLEGQDLNIVSLAYRNKKGIVILVNKWDLLEKETNTAKEYEKAIRKKLEPMDHMPIVFTSVLNKQRIHKALEEAVKVYDQRKRKIKTSVLNDKLLPEIEKVPPPAIKGKYVKIKYITQLPTPTPVFAFFCNNPKYIKTSYERFLENKIRKHFGFEGVPLKLVFREK